MAESGEKQGSVERLAHALETIRMGTNPGVETEGEAQENPVLTRAVIHKIASEALAAVDRGPEPEPSLVDSLASARGFTDGQVEEVAIALAVAWTDKEALDRGGWRYMARQAVAVLRGPEREGVEAVRQRPTPMGQHPHMGQHNG